MSISRLSVGVISICSLGVGLGGCATTSTMQQSQVPSERPIKLLVMEAPITVDSGRLQKVLAPNIKSPLSASDEPIAQDVKHAEEYASEAMKSALAKRTEFIVVTPSVDEQQFLDKMQGQAVETTLSQEDADRIRTTTGADALLKFQITDYGLTPQSWRKGYITFEVTTTLALAAVIAYAGSTVAKAAAGVYLVQEGIEETAETYAGFWALDIVGRPVRIEAELIRLNPVATVWKASDTGLSDVRLSRLTSKVDTPELDNQLNQATDSAIKDIVANLADALSNTKAEHSKHSSL